MQQQWVVPIPHSHPQSSHPTKISQVKMIQKVTDHFLTGSPPLTGIHVCYCRPGQKPTACEVLKALDPTRKATAAVLPDGHTVPVRFSLNVYACTFTGVTFSALVREVLLRSER